MENNNDVAATMPLFESSWKALSAFPQRVSGAKAHQPEASAAGCGKAVEYRSVRSQSALRASSGRDVCDIDNFFQRPSSQPTQGAQSGRTLPTEELLTYMKALGSARDRLEARAKQLETRAGVLDDKMEDVLDLIVRCESANCLSPDEVKPSFSPFPAEQSRTGGSQ